MNNKIIKMHIQNYTCENGAIAKFIIPEDATKNDLRTISEFVDLIIKNRIRNLEEKGDL